MLELMRSLLQISAPRRRWRWLISRGVITVGVHTYGVPNIFYWDEKTKLSIGKYCSIAEGVTIILGGQHRKDWVTTYPFNVFHYEWPAAKDIKGHPASKGDISIGNDVWIGQNALILSGVKIGNGSIIGAGAVVTRDVDDYAIVAGNPAKLIKYRFSQKTIAELIKLSWWDWPQEKIQQNVKFLLAPPNDPKSR